MLHSIKKLFGDQLGATDGSIGEIKDFYFDDRYWAVRYVVADTGTWLPGRQVLLTPHAFGAFHQSGKLLSVNLTRKQIEDSPAIETHKPVSRQFETEYYRYYGWPYYWQGTGVWGMSGIPILAVPAEAPDGEARSASERADGHLRSTQAVSGYSLQASDGTAGTVSDFLMDGKSWAIEQLVIKTGHLFSGAEMVIATSDVNRISFEESTVSVNLTMAAIEQSPRRDLPPASVGA